MFCLGLWCLEGAGEDGDFGVGHLFGHLWVGEFLINQDTFDELSVLNAATCLLLDFNQLQIHISSLQISHIKHRLYSNLSKFVLILADNLRAQRNLSSID